MSSTGFNQTTLPMQSATGTYGVLVGDFNGDGKTDLIRWSAASPSQNQLLVSNGDGSFTANASFNITNQTLFTPDGCYVTLVAMDINGDGLPDLIRSSAATTSPTGALCPAPVASLVYMNKGDGSFAAPVTYTGPALPRDPGAQLLFAGLRRRWQGRLGHRGGRHRPYQPDRCLLAELRRPERHLYPCLP